mmetsp:Transcript_17692/g.51491  ORF Transcript_17692/g.51491 Transcript_17692/m.51491 type:complete len:545 (-) Transcript_17692:147-1781(-)|eukprot:CAMPEP_0113552306 /NCGR_PEP_ID=MMETSP0015_2-20120614/14996_1 /TAXON_ID=2838 /ORGANISM="Odontella" /LENGTH=544 /DNA_ID=CAMNT_0000453273 /DNA_START=133 /DNA_END=1767 /DNA_ORIENTATION=+ /assembly_acc=CAM_ASM_000160
MTEEGKDSEEARTVMDAARVQVMETENEIQKIKVALRSVAAATDASASSTNSFIVSALKVVGLPDAAKPAFKVQMSSPVEELEIKKIFDPLDADAEGTFAKFEGVDPSVATLSVSALDSDIPLGVSEGAEDVAPLCEFDPLSPSKKVTQLDVPIFPVDGGSGTVEAKEEGDGNAPAGGSAKDDTKDDKTDDAAKPESPRPVVFCGPSGVGKGTLIDMLMKRFPEDQFGFSVSHTTRPPRQGEKDGIHYNFTTVDDIKKEIDAGKFIEYAEVHGKYYGTSVAAVETVKSSGKICVLDIDVQGVQSVKKSSLEPIYVFIAPPSMDELEKRLRGRGTESEEDMKERLANAQGELDYGLAKGNFDKIFTNDDLGKTFEELVTVFKEWYPHLSEGGDEKAELEQVSEKPDSSTGQIPLCTVTLKVEYEPSAKDQRDKLYDLLNNASKRKAAAIEKLRKSAAEVSRAAKASPAKASDASKSSPEEAVKSGFLNKKTKKKDNFLKQLYNKTIGPNSLLRAIFPVAKNYVIFFGAAALMHFKGQELALPPPV